MYVCMCMCIYIYICYRCIHVYADICLLVLHVKYIVNNDNHPNGRKITTTKTAGNTEFARINTTAVTTVLVNTIRVSDQSFMNSV